MWILISHRMLIESDDAGKDRFNILPVCLPVCASICASVTNRVVGELRPSQIESAKPACESEPDCSKQQDRV